MRGYCTLSSPRPHTSSDGLGCSGRNAGGRKSGAGTERGSPADPVSRARSGALHLARSGARHPSPPACACVSAWTLSLRAEVVLGLPSSFLERPIRLGRIDTLTFGYNLSKEWAVTWGKYHEDVCWQWFTTGGPVASVRIIGRELQIALSCRTKRGSRGLWVRLGSGSVWEGPRENFHPEPMHWMRWRVEPKHSADGRCARTPPDPAAAVGAAAARHGLPLPHP